MFIDVDLIENDFGRLSIFIFIELEFRVHDFAAFESHLNDDGFIFKIFRECVQIICCGVM